MKHDPPKPRQTKTHLMPALHRTDPPPAVRAMKTQGVHCGCSRLPTLVDPQPTTLGCPADLGNKGKSAPDFWVGGVFFWKTNGSLTQNEKGTTGQQSTGPSERTGRTPYMFGWSGYVKKQENEASSGREESPRVESLNCQFATKMGFPPPKKKVRELRE